MVHPQSLCIPVLASALACNVGAQSAQTPATPAPTIGAFSASPSRITQGLGSRLTWTVSGADSVELSGVGGVTGSSASVTPLATTTYTLTARSAQGSVSTQATVTVDPVPAGWALVSNQSEMGLASARAFVVGSKAYLGTGMNPVGSSANFLMLDPAAPGGWQRKADFPGGSVSNACAFAIGDRGYLGLGTSGTAATSQMWEYEPTGDQWTRKADFPGSARVRPLGVAADGRGYVMMGLGAGNALLKDVWAFDPVANTWTRKADFPGNARSSPLGFVVGTKVYVCLGEAQTAIDPTLWEYDTETDQWTQKRTFPGTPRWGAVAAAAGGKGYVGTGAGEADNLSDLWEYDPQQDAWRRLAAIPSPGRAGAVAFTVGEELFLGLGSLFSATAYPGTCTGDIWKVIPGSIPTPQQAQKKPGKR